MAPTRFFSLCCICAEWRRTISSREDKYASGGQRFHWELEALKQVPLQYKTIRYKDAIEALVSTMYFRESAFMDQITCKFAPSQPPLPKMVPKRSHCA